MTYTLRPNRPKLLFAKIPSNYYFVRLDLILKLLFHCGATHPLDASIKIDKNGLHDLHVRILSLKYPNCLDFREEKKVQ